MVILVRYFLSRIYMVFIFLGYFGVSYFLGHVHLLYIFTMEHMGDRSDLRKLVFTQKLAITCRGCYRSVYASVAMGNTRRSEVNGVLNGNIIYKWEILHCHLVGGFNHLEKY